MNIRKGRIDDVDKVYRLYKKVSQTEGGIARFEDEVTEEYVEGFVKNALDDGVFIVAEKDGDIVGEIHGYKIGIRVFDHVLSNITIVVSPDFCGEGIGKKIFLKLIEEGKKIEGVSRMELIARESNKKALKFYESLGFEIEGKMRQRIKNSKGEFEADILMGIIF
ncbi:MULTISPECIES: GNAT family N-acetyltransferase [Psychrilyobacter]|uniref:GNAT family N-acetyltransferase n=1 Tax=Psychrilyobacter piezotolerans TaxID=2293438 RepID=A0ABX9KET3_9FUSO|nr:MULTISPECIES: N-acetyltransferase [Psychrilyobacter]MCS5423211.1 GNAT family N-acetyltransferase [Psychrilyobacter sp. S5]NDI78724.1 GNAT family N-acetyltransferase [Psychrilyobacter piezotolerans]RDE59899.1 GNAT family N-acetyltransferase [Psychrilyobacter sp. S5]REI40180.1 GNAT family N-acetyltransferase [Psychrilyobacter piezotolerans]